MRAISVGVSTSSIEPSLNNGIVDGIGHYTNQLICQLRMQECYVKGYAFPTFRSESKLSNSHQLGLPFALNALLSCATSGRIGRLNPPVDIFHSTDFKVLPMSCPVVATLWDAIPIAHPEWFENSFVQRLAPKVIKCLSGYADKIIAVSEHAAQDIVRYFDLPESKIVVVPWAVDDVWFEPLDECYKRKISAKYALKDRFILSIGTLQPRKNFMRLIDAYMELPKSIRRDHELVIVGKYGWCSKELVKRLNALGRDEGVRWLSSVDSDKELRAIYHSAHVFVYPSLYEGFGVPILEAFASGIPVITSNTTSIPEVSRGKALEVNPESTSDIYEAIQLVLGDDAFRDHLIQGGRKRAAQMRWDHTIQKTIGVYSEFVDCL